MDEKIRINKYLSEAGICSRREADRMIEEGRITVNGKKAESGQKVSLEDEICADNIPVHKNEKKVLLLFNKPRGIVCSTKQQFDETTVTDIWIILCVFILWADWIKNHRAFSF